MEEPLDEEVPSPSRWTLVRRALTLRCPCCGSREVFEGWFRMRDHCPNGGLATDRVVGHWIGAIGINTIVSFGALAIVIVVGTILTYPEIQVAPLLAAMLGTAVLVPLVFWPFSQTVWTAIDIMMRPVQVDELDPRYLGR
jgi:uncharacterized protein (DUF983 family)